MVASLGDGRVIVHVNMLGFFCFVFLFCFLFSLTPSMIWDSEELWGEASDSA